MIVYPDVRQGVFLERPNRFLARVVIGGREEICHVKNTGRCRELLVPGARVWCQYHDDPARKTRWSLLTVEKGPRLFNLDSQVPNRLAAQWVQAGGLGAAPDWLKPEKTFLDSRLDLAFGLRGRDCLMEVKGVTLEEDGVARFPDAPTERGRRHLRTLEAAVVRGFDAWVLFVCQMDGLSYFEPNRAKDPEFAEQLVHAASRGVGVLAVQCTVEPDRIAVTDPVPVRL